MRTGLQRFFTITSILFLAQLSYAQNASDEGSGALPLVLLMLVILIAFGVIIQVSDNLLRIEAKQSGLDEEKTNFSIFPGLREIFRPSKPSYAGDASIHYLDKGFDLKLRGEAEKTVDDQVKVSTFAVQPPNYRGIVPIPKMEVEVGDTVKAGDPLFHDKRLDRVKFVSPVSGEVIAINRGDRRAITEVVILADKKQEYRELAEFDLDKSSREELVDFLLDTGGWTLFRHRPYNILPDVEDVPDNIFISTFDTGPTAPDLNFVVEGREAVFQKGLDVLNKLTAGKVRLGLSANGKNAPSPAFTEARGVEKHWFHGKHPAGNVGVQIHHISPVTPKSSAWTLTVQDVITLGALFAERRWNTERLIAVTGAELNAPKYVRTFAGANVGDLLKGNLKQDHIRAVSGDVLSGEKKGLGNFLNFYDDQLSVLEEGDFYETFGWLLPDTSTPSASKALPTALFPSATFRPNTNTHGEKRAFVVSGEYEKVLPMDVYPQQLMKAVLTNDYEKMEGLGIHELVEEDVALCEFVCTSKQPLQKILRTGLDMMHEQG